MPAWFNFAYGSSALISLINTLIMCARFSLFTSTKFFLQFLVWQLKLNVTQFDVMSMMYNFMFWKIVYSIVLIGLAE